MKMNPRTKPKICSRLFWLTPLFVWFAASLALLRTTFAYDRNQFELLHANHSTRGAKKNRTLKRLLGYEHFIIRRKALLHQTQPPNALPTSWRCLS